jgi:predicted nucleotidyltransferase
VKVFWLDRDLLKSRIRRAAGNLSRDHEAVVRVILFGSVASGRALPSSDADILVVVREIALPFIDRANRFRDYFADIGLGVDLFVYTEQEIAAGSIPLAVTALRTGIDLLPAR